MPFEKKFFLLTSELVCLSHISLDRPLYGESILKPVSVLHALCEVTASTCPLS